MERQRYGYCRKCKRQILLTLQKNGRGWLECEPYIGRFVESYEPDAAEFITPDGTVKHGQKVWMDQDGELGYRGHECVEVR